uniref:desmocollin-1-like n=1 Tax=Podarcis muralis TaxID=64176 RepID=UPI0010A09150|nr:desmocollin-1-like [Podarcis muralis]
MVLLAARWCKGSILCRAIWLQLLFSLLVLSLSSEACKKVTFNVPHKLKAGAFVGQVNMKQCLNHSEIIYSNNPNFTIQEDGSLYTTRDVSLTSHEIIITIFLKSNHEQEQKKIHISLLTHSKKVPIAKARHLRATFLRRTKRRWGPVPTILMENSLGPYPMQIQQLLSDTSLTYDIRYSISGHGVDKPPYNYFYIEEDTGNLFVTCPIDREEYPEFQLICYAMTADGYTPEIPLVHIIRIEDDNDNAPVFEQDVYTFLVFENCGIGTLVGQVTATDNDEPYTLHTEVKYRIVSQDLQSYQNLRVFAINPDSGSITVVTSHLDRETTPEYTLQIEARDMGGQEFGLCTTAKVIITVGDVNDNAPQLEQNVYEVKIYENEENIEILCIPVRDNDEPGTPSWLAEFTIIKGNEDNAFSMNIDQERNVGCLLVLKGLDYETSKERRLEIVVNNEAPYILAPNSRAPSRNPTTIVIEVMDVDEGPTFATEYIITLRESFPKGTVVGIYQAYDPETGESTGISYGIINDPCNWITIDETGQLITTTILDRDILNEEYSQCIVTVSATDQSGKTGQGKIVINIMDENDNFPVITTKNYTMCKDKTPICITAFDADLPPYTGPFHFEIENRMGLTWRLTPNDDESALLSPVEDIDYGYYIIPVRIYDNEGNSGISEITVHYCDCDIPSNCSERSTVAALENGAIPVDRVPYQAESAFGPWGIAATVLGSVLSLSGMMVPCGYWLHKRNSNTEAAPGEAPAEASNNAAFENLMMSNTEAPGEEMTVLNILPVSTLNTAVSMGTVAEKTGKQGSLEVIKGEGHHPPELVKGGGNHLTASLHNIKQPIRSSSRDLCSQWQEFTNPHLAKKVFLCEQEEERKRVGEYVHSYKYEGKGSLVGSLSSCTGESSSEELEFLNEPEPAFKTLVEAFVMKKHASIGSETHLHNSTGSYVLTSTVGGSNASEYQLLETTGQKSALVPRTCLLVSQRQLVGHCENRMLDQMGHWSDTAGSSYLLNSIEMN